MRSPRSAPRWDASASSSRSSDDAAGGSEPSAICRDTRCTVWSQTARWASHRPSDSRTAGSSVQPTARATSTGVLLPTRRGRLLPLA